MRHLLTLVSPSPTPTPGPHGSIGVLATLAIVVFAALVAAGIVSLIKGRDSGDDGGGWGS